MLNHPNLVSLYEVIDSEETEKLYMVIEYIPLGEIMSYVPKTDRYRRRERREGEAELEGVTAEGYFDEEHCALYFVDLLHGLAHLHRHHICHRLAYLVFYYLLRQCFSWTHSWHFLFTPI